MRRWNIYREHKDGLLNGGFLWFAPHEPDTKEYVSEWVISLTKSYLEKNFQVREHHE